MEQEFHEASTAGPLAGLVTGMVGYRSSGLTPALHRGLPSSSLTLVLSIDEPVLTGSNPDPSAAQPLATIVGGLHERPAFIFRGCSDGGVQLSVHPLAARRLLGFPSAELTPLATEGSRVLGNGLTHLTERMRETSSWNDRFDLTQDYLLRRTTAEPTTRGPRAEVVAAWAWLARRHGQGRIDELTRHVSLSGRQLGQLFRNEVGIGPKAVARLMRFEHARDLVVARVRAGAPVRLSDVAQTCGYYDHAHLDREFRDYAGLSPTAWLREENQNIQAGGQAQTSESTA
jgi:AraC-like DNA-binding protein